MNNIRFNRTATYFKTIYNLFFNQFIRDILIIFLGILFLFFLLTQVNGQELNNEIIKVDTSLVSFSLRTTDSKGRNNFVDPQQLKVLADGQNQDFTAERTPITHYNVLIDISSSMRNAKIDKVKKAVQKMLQAGKSGQTFTIYLFSDEVRLLGKFQASDAEAVREKLDYVSIEGDTALYDAVEQILDNNSDTTAPLIIFTDGTDSASRIGAEDLERKLSLRNNITYLIVLNDRMACREDKVYCDTGTANIAGQKFQQVFQSILYLPVNAAQLEKLAISIPQESNNILQISFAPTDAVDTPGKHQIRVNYQGDSKAGLFYRNSYLKKQDTNSFNQKVLNPIQKLEIVQPVLNINLKNSPLISKNKIKQLAKEYKAIRIEDLKGLLRAIKPDKTAEEAFSSLPEAWQQMLVKKPDERLLKASETIKALTGTEFQINQLNSPTPGAISDSNVLILITKGMLDLTDEAALEGVIIHEAAHSLFVAQSLAAKLKFNQALKEKNIKLLSEAREELALIEIRCDLIVAKFFGYSNRPLNSYYRILELLKEQEDSSNVVYHPQPMDRRLAMEMVSNYDKSVYALNTKIH